MKHIYLFTFQKLGLDQGIKRYIDELSYAISVVNNFKVTIVTFYSDNATLLPYEENGIRHIHVPMPQQQENSRKFVYYDLKLYNIACAKILEKHIDPNEQNIFHLNYNQHSLIIDHLRKISPSAKIVFTIHFMRWVTAVDHDENRFKGIITHNDLSTLTPKELLCIDDFNSLKQICNNVDKIICLSTYTYYLLTSIYNIDTNKIAMVKNGVKDAPPVNHTQLSTTLQESPLLEKSPKVLIYSGRIEENKGFHILLHALHKVIKKNKNVILIVAGTGDQAKFMKLANKCLGYIYFVGEVNHEELNNLYGIADIGVHPSLNEQCSFSVLEMMRNGLPIIGFDLSGMKDIITTGNNGTKINVKKGVTITDQILEMVDDLAIAILEYLENPQLIKERGTYARERYLKEYSSQVFESNMAYTYSNLII
ncbi:glycosyltransferase [Sphingobacterium thalpophilum]|uniref:Glycogen synthase n=1 Tax=Sphingobacterium thalpophilum TaxID=259 RepID=A0A4U9VPH4_9SPHI|nr:glycosyltransferase [Sphingobacterium thalpophilum]VTR49245.1 Glycogen synthase [Sphingobacterium thalpophilum]